MNIIIKPKGMVVLATLLSAGVLLGVALPHFLTPRAAAPVQPKSLIHHLENPDFEAVGADGKSPRNWTLWSPASDAPSLSYTDTNRAGRFGVHRSAHDYEVHTFQTLAGIDNGTYTLRARVKTGGHGKQLASLRAEMFDGQGSARSASIPNDATEFRTIEVSGIRVTNGRCKIGFHSKASGGRWIAFDDVEFALSK